MVKKNKKRKGKMQRGGSQCYSTECAAHALKVINDKNALVPLNKNIMEFPLSTKQMNVKQKGGGSTNVWRKLGLAKPNDLMNDIFDGISNVKNTFLGNEGGSTSDTLEHPIADNEKILMDIKGSDNLTIDAYLAKANLPITLTDVQKTQLGSGKKRRKSRRKSQRKSRKKLKKSKKRRSKKVRKTKKRRKSRRK